MNMSDLAALAAQKAQLQQQHGPDAGGDDQAGELKTPTQEEATGNQTREAVMGLTAGGNGTAGIKVSGL